MIERLIKGCRMGDTDAALTLAMEARRREDARLFQVALAGLLLAPATDPKKHGVAIMLAMISSNTSQVWQHPLWEGLYNIQTQKEESECQA